MTASALPDEDATAPQYSGRDVIYRDGAISALDVQRAADALLRQGIKPSVAAVREQLGGGSPNTLTPMLSKYWEVLGQRLGAGPESLERVPESLARVTELFWRRALEEARARLKLLQEPAAAENELLPLQDQVLKLSVALAEARAREGEQLTHLSGLSAQTTNLRNERNSLMALLKSTQALLEQQNARVAALEHTRHRDLTATLKRGWRANTARKKTARPKPKKTARRAAPVVRKRKKKPTRRRN